MENLILSESDFHNPKPMVLTRILTINCVCVKEIKFDYKGFSSPLDGEIGYLFSWKKPIILN